MSTQRVLVLATGVDAERHLNMGEALADALKLLDVSESWWLTVIGDTQLRVEHAIALQRQDLVLFIDVAAGTEHAGSQTDDAVLATLKEIRPPEGYHFASLEGALEPIGVMHTLSKLRSNAPLPRCFYLQLSFDVATTPKTLTKVGGLLLAPSAEEWSALAEH